MAHPDQCPKLTLHGVGFAIPPRGMRIVPEFGPGGVTVSATEVERWPEAKKLLAIASIHPGEACQRCGRPADAVLEVDLKRDIEFLATSFGLAGELLDRQYDLTPQQKADLLAFDSDRIPVWIVQLLRWCAGVETQEA